MALAPAAAHLAEWPHRRVDLLRRHPRSVVADLDADQAVAKSRCHELDHAAGLGELDGVGQHIDQDLLEAQRIGIELRQIGREPARHGDAALASPRVDDQQAALDRRLERHGLALDGELAGLDLGYIEDAVDEREQMIGGLPDIAGIERNLLRIVALEGAQHLGKADDGIERGAELMAHIGDEFRLGLGGKLGLDLGGMECQRGLVADDRAPETVRELGHERAILEPLPSECTHYDLA